MAWEWGNQWLAGLFLDGLHLHLNLFKVRPPTPSEQPSTTQPGSQLLAHRSREKKTPWWPGDKEHIAALCIRGGRSSWRKERGLRWEFFRVRFVVFWTLRIYICLGALGFCGQTGKKGNTGSDFARSWLPASESPMEFIFWRINQRYRCTSDVSFGRVGRLLCLHLHICLPLNSVWIHRYGEAIWFLFIILFCEVCVIKTQKWLKKKQYSQLTVMLLNISFF